MLVQKQKIGSFIFIGLMCFVLFSCAKKTKISYPENVRNTFINSIEIPNEISQDETIKVHINYMLFNPCWSFYNVEESWNKDTLFLKVNIQKIDNGMCAQVIVNEETDYEFNIPKKENYFIKYINNLNEEVSLSLKVNSKKIK